MLLLLALAAAPLRVANGSDLTEQDLSGEWYVLIHYKDDKSKDKSITKFKDFAWSVKQTGSWIDWQYFPYVLFDEGVAEIRRYALTEHQAWEPDEPTWAQLKRSLRVSTRAATKKRLKGSVKDGFKSASAESMGARTLTFSRDWDVQFDRERIRIKILDSLSGGVGLASMEDSTLFEIDRAVSADELRGSWREGTRKGTFRMVRAKERRVGK